MTHREKDLVRQILDVLRAVHENQNEALVIRVRPNGWSVHATKKRG